MSVAPKVLRLIRVFVSSPGDVPEEREIVRTCLKKLEGDARRDWNVQLELVAWDAPESNTVLDATLTPQEAINQGLARPSECDLTIVILWSRLGTPLPDQYRKKTGERYESGTEWEYLDAVESRMSRSDGLPSIIIYRRTLPPQIATNNSNWQAIREQWDKVERFFAQFSQSDGSLTGSINEYKAVDDFRERFPGHLRELIRRIVKIHAAIPTQPPIENPAPPTPSAPKPPTPSVMAPKVVLTALTRLQHYPIGLPPHGFCAAESGGRIWICTGLRAELYHLRQPSSLSAFKLPDRRWKAFSSRVWREGLLAADWDGCLFHLTGQRATSDPLYSPAWDDTPMHILAVSDEGILWAASWNGRLRRWSADGAASPLPNGTGVEALPTHLIPLPNAACLVVDQSGLLTVFDDAGSVRWQWQSSTPVRAVRVDAQRWPYHYLIWNSAQQVIQLTEGSSVAAAVNFDSPLRLIAETPNGKIDRWYAVALEGGQIDWLSTSSPTVDRVSRVLLDESLLQFCPVSVNGQEESRNILGLTDSHRVVSISGHDVRHFGEHDRPVTANRMQLDSSGRLLYLMQSNAVDAYRNPCVPTAVLEMELLQPNQEVVVKDVYSRLVLRLRNSGPVEIHSLKAWLQPDGVDRAFQLIHAPQLPVRAGATTELEFSVCSPSLGHWPLRLHLELMDVGGPPATHLELPLTVESRIS